MKKQSSSSIWLYTLSLLIISIMCGCHATRQRDNEEFDPGINYEYKPSTILVHQYGKEIHLGVFGNASEDSIAVYILGEVKRPGLYHMPKESTVKHALTQALGPTHFAWWSSQSGIVRPHYYSVPTVITFTRGNKKEDELISLKNGDQLFLGACVD